MLHLRGTDRWGEVRLGTSSHAPVGAVPEIVDSTVDPEKAIDVGAIVSDVNLAIKQIKTKGIP